MKFSGSSWVTGICVPPISDENSAVSRLTSNQVLVLDDVPVAAEGVFLPVHRVFGAQAREHLVVLTATKRSGSFRSMPSMAIGSS